MFYMVLDFRSSHSKHRPENCFCSRFLHLPAGRDSAGRWASPATRRVASNCLRRAYSICTKRADAGLLAGRAGEVGGIGGFCWSCKRVDLDGGDHVR